MKRIATVVAAGLVLVPSTVQAKQVDPEGFGLHVQVIGSGPAPKIELSAVRLWDIGARWDQVESKRGKFNWWALDRAVENAEASGAKEILYVLGSTP
jgi:hypothetical protein